MQHLKKTRTQAFLILISIALLCWTAFGNFDLSESSMTPTPRANRLFKPYGEEVYQLAQKIERGQSIRIQEIMNLPYGVNERYGQEITLLFLALGARNVEAIDMLFEAGADPYMIDRPSTGSERSFVYYLTLPGHETDHEQGFQFINQLIRLYLKHGGDPNHRLDDVHGDSLISEVALIRNYEAINILLKAGADPWADSNEKDNAMTLLAVDMVSQDFLNQLIDQGYFEHVEYAKLERFIHWLSAYEQRGDDISLANQAIGRRVLKRHPDFKDNHRTQRLFLGPIPWNEIAKAD